MKKFISILIILLSLILTLLTIILSTTGIETSKFNNIISQQINQTNKNLNLQLNTVKFKLDIKEISLFLDTNNPQINYRETLIPAKNIKVYVDFISIIKSEPKIKKISLVLDQLDIKKLKKISVTFKPSNLTSFIKNKIKQGKMSAELELYLDNNNLLDNFILRGEISNLKAEIINNINLEKTNFSFFADKSDLLIKNISGATGPIKITEGDLKLKQSSEILLEANFKTNVKYNDKSINFIKSINNSKYFENIIKFEGDLKNSFFINFDKTYKIKNYNYKSSGDISNIIINFPKPLENFFLNERIDKLSLVNSKFNTSFTTNKNNTKISGKYSINEDNPLPFNFENNANKNLLNLNLNVDYKKHFELELINYKKQEGDLAKISLNLDKKNDKININKFSLIDSKNSILLDNIKFNKNQILSIKKISIKTHKENKKNNDFQISYNKKLSIKGDQFDARNLPKILNTKKNDNSFTNISKDIEVDFSNIIAPLSENLKNFKLIGKIEKGKFVKISSKGDFGQNNFLDISMKEDKKSKKKYLEVYSDLTKPLLTEYNFFKGLTGGKLLYSSIIEKNTVSSKLKIENFKVINAPGLVKLLSLADLGGLADLAEGEGVSFDSLEISMEKKNGLLKLNEILALGPSISVLMEGYQDQTTTSLRGTLIPAKTLNKMISKIPVVGKIIIPKEVGEGLFGISFKIKGPPGKIRTTINPIRTLTPRFLQKIVDRNRTSK
tara:strand:- start:733 stop:2916 length:2184 start_codon:yes stop_codon:yes gene_type:complete